MYWYFEIEGVSFPDTLTSSLVPIKPFPIPPPDPPAIEVEQFVLDRASFCDTFDSYINHLYVYPMNLRYEHQKSFAKVSSIQKFIQVLYSFLS